MDDLIIFADPYDYHNYNPVGITWFNAQHFYYMGYDALLFGSVMKRVYVSAKPWRGRVRKDVGSEIQRGYKTLRPLRIPLRTLREKTLSYQHSSPETRNLEPGTFTPGAPIYPVSLPLIARKTSELIITTVV